MKRLFAIGFSVLVLGSLAFTTGGQLENRDPFCASCHTQPETTYFQREMEPQAVDLATLHAAEMVRCIDCHSDAGLRGRANSLTLGARDLVSFLIGRYEQPAHMTQPILDSFCLKCHADLMAKRTFRNHYHLFLEEWQHEDAQAGMCVDCHSGHDPEGDASIDFLNMGTTRPVCDACHARGERLEHEGVED